MRDQLASVDASAASPHSSPVACPAVQPRRHTTPNSNAVLRGIFGPSRWYAKAAQILGVSERMVYMLANEERRITTRQRAIMLAYADRRVENLIQEQLGEVRALNDLYRRAKLDLQAARRLLDKRTQ